ncbi:hypothetical protein T492DRAFT_919151 [Pavlovales sp. CCMP2436]|nr:hypothetical protein T492DRAFT_919151 [Pavlovales sp. CCMP2436]|mmetsp:Transcript_4499/g.11542  ORF Transcript_4499/g.11542 Transcript_4499/m.11542 type:complete len:274 (-) Transcript_4499:51-872(-)
MAGGARKLSACNRRASDDSRAETRTPRTSEAAPRQLQTAPPSETVYGPAPSPPPAPPAPAPPPAPSAPTLASLALRALLLCEYDAESNAVIAAALLATVPIERVAALMAQPAVFGSLASYPGILDALRAHLAVRPKAARRICEAAILNFRLWLRAHEAEHTGCAGDAATIEHALAVLSACDRLLCTGLFKRDIVGPQLPSELANLMRALRKLAQRVLPFEDGQIGHWRPVTHGLSSAPLAQLSERVHAGGVVPGRHPAAPDAVMLRRLDQHTG